MPVMLYWFILPLPYSDEFLTDRWWVSFACSADADGAASAPHAGLGIFRGLPRRAHLLPHTPPTGRSPGGPAQRLTSWPAARRWGRPAAVGRQQQGRAETDSDQLQLTGSLAQQLTSCDWLAARRKSLSASAESSPPHKLASFDGRQPGAGADQLRLKAARRKSWPPPETNSDQLQLTWARIRSSPAAADMSTAHKLTSCGGRQPGAAADHLRRKAAPRLSWQAAAEGSPAQKLTSYGVRQPGTEVDQLYLPSSNDSWVCNDWTSPASCLHYCAVVCASRFRPAHLVSQSVSTWGWDWSYRLTVKLPRRGAELTGVTCYDNSPAGNRLMVYLAHLAANRPAPCLISSSDISLLPTAL